MHTLRTTNAAHDYTDKSMASVCIAHCQYRQEFDACPEFANAGEFSNDGTAFLYQASHFSYKLAWRRKN